MNLVLSDMLERKRKTILTYFQAYIIFKIRSKCLKFTLKLKTLILRKMHYYFFFFRKLQMGL